MGRENQGILSGLSPEEILLQKEMQGGVVYDDPFIPDSPVEKFEPNSPGMMNSKPPLEEEILSESVYKKSPQEDSEFLTSLGKAETFIPPTPPPTTVSPQSSFSPGLEIGWKNLPLRVLPSGGLFYPEGTKIAIRPADTKEIKHYSTIDEQDLLDLNEKLNFILDKCSIMNFPDRGVVSYKDLKQEDRFFLIMAIRDLTFVQGENRIILTPETSCENKRNCPVNEGVELRTGILSSYEIDPRVMKYYSPQTRNFVFPIKKTGKEITMWVPSIGVMESVSQFVVNSVSKGIEVEDSFAKIAPFIFPEWRVLNDSLILKKMKESDEWTKEEFSLYFELSEAIKIGTEVDINFKCPTCGAEVTAPITFPGGFKSLFVISDIFRELL